MTKPDLAELIPREAVEAHAVEWATRQGFDWMKMSDGVRRLFRDNSRAATAAMLEAWPGKLQTHNHDGLIVMRPAIILLFPEGKP